MPQLSLHMSGTAAKMRGSTVGRGPKLAILRTCEMIPQPITDDLAPLVAKLEQAHYRPGDAQFSDSFGSYRVEFSGPSARFRIVRDRSQYYIDGLPRNTLEPAGLWRAFDDRAEFEVQLLSWLSPA